MATERPCRRQQSTSQEVGGGDIVVEIPGGLFHACALNFVALACASAAVSFVSCSALSLIVSPLRWLMSCSSSFYLAVNFLM